jgi:alpha-D-ribose 1-methylphosphonate 5-phosphate C-P lyase
VTCSICGTKLGFADCQKMGSGKNVTIVCRVTELCRARQFERAQQNTPAPQRRSERGNVRPINGGR